MAKTLGYIIGIAGLVVIALSFSVVRSIIGISTIFGLGDTYLMVIGIVLILVGGFLAFRNKGGEKPKEVPIYQGEQVVGYRRTG
jgi:hypothetical protein